MKLHVRSIAVVAAVAALAATLVGAPAQAHAKSTPLGNRSLAAVLTADTSGFDHNGKDFDVLTAAVLAVLKAKPSSPVKVLTDGNTALTAFLPTDSAFQRLAKALTHTRRLPSEKSAFTTVAGLGIDTVEAVLLYHVVPGATIDARTALKSDGVKLTTAAGSTITVHVVRYYCVKRITLIDADHDARNPTVVKADINKGNKQIAHAIDRVLRPIDLP